MVINTTMHIVLIVKSLKMHDCIVIRFHYNSFKIFSLCIIVIDTISFKPILVTVDKPILVCIILYYVLDV